MQRSIQFIFIICCFMVLFSSCNTVKYLADNEYVIVENKIEFDKVENLAKEDKTRTGLNDLITPSLNSTWNKFPVLIYHKNRERKDKGKKEIFIKRAEAPSLYETREVELNRLKMEKYLLDHGHIGSKVKTSHTTKGKKTKVKYSVYLKPVHTIKTLTIISDSTEVGKVMRNFEQHKIIKEGDPYSKEKIDEERKRYAQTLKNGGFINITEDYFYFTVDTQYAENVVDFGIHFKVPDQKEILTRYKIGNTYLYWTDSNQKISKDSTQIKPGLYSIGSQQLMKPKVIDITVDQDKGEYLNAGKQELTLNHFLSYNVFKHVNQKYSAPYGDSLNIIDRYLDLAYASDGNTGLDFEFNNRSGSFFGSAVTGSYANRNTFKGAETFSVSLTLGAELQVNENQSLLNSLLGEINTTLSVPRLLIPNFIKYKPSSFFIPDTFVGIKNSVQNRIDSYSAVRSTLSLGYHWRETRKSNHEITLLSLSYLNIFNRSPEFIAIEQADRRLELSLQDLFDIGIEYTYTFTNQNSKINRNYAFFTGTIRTSGDTLSAIVRSTNSADEKSIFGIPFSQYAKFQLDYRYYFNIKKNQLIARVKTGLGVAYGNSEEIPYNEQFFVGGAQSLRGFQLRGLGPGDFVIDPDLGGPNPVRNQFFDQTGDIILEMNLEYRFPIFGYLKGATFIDAGNIWLINADPTKAGGQFQLDRFYEQIAINTGVGLRFDIESFIVLRLDLGLLLRRPFENVGFEWTPSNANSFLGDNLRLQLGLGYPF